MKLIGSTTSPFVRRSRVALIESKIPFELVNSATEEGQAELRARSPIWKVPVLCTDDRVIFDSREIVAFAAANGTPGRLATAPDPIHGKNILNAVDGALESAIAVFYLRRDGIDTGNLPFAKRQVARVREIAQWLTAEAAADRFARAPGLAELSWVCTLDWMEFREFIDPNSLGDFSAVYDLFADWDSVRDTFPVA